MLKMFLSRNAVRSEPPVRVRAMMEELEDRRLMSVTLTGGTVAGVEGKFTKGTIATFVSSDQAPLLAANYTATIDWGDGQSSAAVIRADSSNPGQFSVIGAHRYAQAGVFAPTVSVHDAVDATDATASASATISDVPLKGNKKHVNAKAGESFNRMVAIFHDMNRLSVAGDFTATIDWGDGLGSSAGTIVPNGNGTFRVLGTHTYSAAGSFVVTVTITDSGGSSVVVTSDAKVKAAKLKKH